jgi:hydrogenase maturation protein HypF
VSHAREELRLSGVVQGVGLRPWAARRAQAHGLGGAIRNTAAGVWIVLEGERVGIEAWLHDLAHDPPRGLALKGVERSEATPAGERVFRILHSETQGPAAGLPPDIPVCQPCLAEILDPASRRFGYVFTHCADCGPRASVLQALPWDRERTTLAPFPLCAACRREYEDPGDRRHHAEGIACPACGPRLLARAPDGSALAGDPLARALAVLAAGGIVALKGYGGFHLAVDAFSEAAVARLRKRKGRPTKPLALLVPDLETARSIAWISATDEALLAGPLRPVVVAPRRSGAHGLLPIAPSVAPTTGDHGLLLPCAPLHHLLLRAPPGDEAERPRALVFTSANRSGDPTLWEDAETLRELASVADLFLTHDRAVARPCDDSVFRTSAGGAIALRLSRAAAPRVLHAPGRGPVRPCVLAIGGDLKCAPALAVGSEILLDAHVGDLESPAAADAAFERALRLCREQAVRPDCIVHDLHPGYVGTRLAGELAAAFGAETLAVQHHHAHALAAAVEHGLDVPFLAVVLDGFGWGGDGTVWGGEILLVDGVEVERVAYLERVRIAGGDAAAREPWRAAAAWLERAFPGGGAPALAWHARQDAGALALLSQAARQGVNAPFTSSCGRLFDALASLLDCGDRSAFEGEAAMALEALAASSPPCELAIGSVAEAIDPGVAYEIACADLVRGLALDLARGAARAALARRFHDALAGRLAVHAAALAAARGVRSVVLSGGCLQNRLLAEALAGALVARGLEPLTHRRLPPNDGNLAVGQAWYGLRWLCRIRR